MHVTNVIIGVFARINSSRLLGKALLPINGIPAIAFLLNRCKKSDVKTVLLTSKEASDDVLACWAESCGVDCIRGDSDNIWNRVDLAYDKYGFRDFVRVTGDDIFFDYNHVNICLSSHYKSNAHYSHTMSIPKGCEFEIYDYNAMKEAVSKNTSIKQEYLTHIAEAHIDQGKRNCIIKRDCDYYPVNRYRISLSIDTLEDYQFVRKFIVDVENKYGTTSPLAIYSELDFKGDIRRLKNDSRTH